MVLADAEDIEADLVGKLDLLEEVAQPPCRVGLGPYVGEGVEAKFHRRFLSGRVRRTRTFGAVQAPGGRIRTIVRLRQFSWSWDGRGSHQTLSRAIRRRGGQREIQE